MGWGPKPYLPFIYFQLFQLPSPPSLTGVPIWPLHSTILVQGHVKALWKTFFSAKIENVDKFKSICGQKLMLTKYNFEEVVIQFHFVREKPNIWQLCVCFSSPCPIPASRNRLANHDWVSQSHSRDHQGRHLRFGTQRRSKVGEDSCILLWDSYKIFVTSPKKWVYMSYIYILSKNLKQHPK